MGAVSLSEIMPGLGSLGIEVSIVLALILLNGVFAMAEIALISVRRPRLEQLANAGNRRAARALGLVQSPERFLSTVQIGITLIGIFTGAFSGATITEVLAGHLSATPLARYAEPLALGAVVVLITYFTLVLGELLPKQLALLNAERWSLLLAGPMSALACLGAPAVHLLSHSTRFAQRVLGMENVPEGGITEEELRLIMRQATQSGTLEQSEGQMLERVMRLDDLRVTAFMVPRTDVVWVDAGDSAADILSKLGEWGRAQVLVCEKSIDTVRGVVTARELLTQHVQTGRLQPAAAARPPFYLFERISILRALDQLSRSGHSVGVVLDEYGGVSGMLTLDDVFAKVFSGRQSPREGREERAKRREDGSWLVPGMMPVHEFHALLEIAEPSERRSYDTVGGLVMSLLGRMPEVAASARYCGYRIEVVDMDGLRVDQVLVQRIAETDLETSDLQ